jgi:outer membrane protein assembly factor BamB
MPRFLTVLCGLSLAWSAAAPAEDWPQFRGPRGDGTWQAPSLPDRFPEGGLKTVWKREIGGGYAGISVSGDRVCTLDRQTAPTEAERVVCFSAADGSLVWEHRYPVDYKGLDYGNGPRSQPTVHDGRVYAVGALGHLHCLDAVTGKLLWQSHYQQDWNGRLPTWGYAASPVILDDLVILQPGGMNGTCLVAVDRKTGREVWRSLSDEAGYATPLLFRAHDRDQLVVWTPSHIRGVDARTGEAFWASPYEITYGVSIAKPILQENLVFVAGYWAGSKAIRLGETPQGAKLAWEENKFLRGLMSQPLYRDGHVYLLDKQYGLTCFELATGKKLWDDRNTMTPRDRNPQASLVWLGETDRAIILNAEGELILARLTPEGYDEQSRAKVIGSTWAHPAFAGNRVYARSDTEIVCVELGSE